MILQMLYINESCFTFTSIWPSLFLLPFLPLPITFFHTLAHLLDLGMNLPPNLQQVTTNTTFKNPFENPCFVLKMSSFWLTVDLSSASLQRQECHYEWPLLSLCLPFNKHATKKFCTQLRHDEKKPHEVHTKLLINRCYAARCLKQKRFWLSDKPFLKITRSIRCNGTGEEEIMHEGEETIKNPSYYQVFPSSQCYICFNRRGKSHPGEILTCSH